MTPHNSLVFRIAVHALSPVGCLDGKLYGSFCEVAVPVQRKEAYNDLERASKQAWNTPTCVYETK